MLCRVYGEQSYSGYIECMHAASVCHDRESRHALTWHVQWKSAARAQRYCQPKKCAAHSRKHTVTTSAKPLGGRLVEKGGRATAHQLMRKECRKKTSFSSPSFASFHSSTKSAGPPARPHMHVAEYTALASTYQVCRVAADGCAAVRRAAEKRPRSSLRSRRTSKGK